jgi:hypothetical protein
VADGVVLGLYLLAYVVNLLATPIDDQLTFEARRDLGYWALPLQQAFVKKVGEGGLVVTTVACLCCVCVWGAYWALPLQQAFVKKVGEGVGGAAQ